jgi:hypothetical protein
MVLLSIYLIYKTGLKKKREVIERSVHINMKKRTAD